MNTLIGMVLCIFGGVGNGSFLLPLKFQKRWQWEHTWGVGIIWMYLIFPWVTAWFTVPHLLTVYRDAGFANVGLTFFWGLVMGTGSLTFTIGIRLLGMALGYAVLMGMIVIFSTTTPLFVKSSDQVATVGGITLLVGVAVFLISVIICSVAGSRRLKETSSGSTSQSGSGKKVNYPLAILVCVYSSFGCSAFYFAQAFADQIKAAAIDHGAVPSAGADAVFCIQLLGAFIPNAIYVVIQLSRKRQWHLLGLGFSEGVLREYFLAIAIGFLWYYSVWLYGRAYSFMGPIGLPAGAAVFMAINLLTGSGWGFKTGEWKNTSKATKRIMLIGLLFLVVAVAVVSIGNYFSS